MRHNHFFLTFFILVMVQVIICNYLNLSQYITISLLPFLVTCIPHKYSTTVTLLIAFVSALAVDFLAEGLVGINIVALLPVAFCRNGLISLVLGSEVFARKEEISVHKHGIAKVSALFTLAQALFLAIYIWVDCAGTRTFLFCLTRFTVSLVCNVILSMILINLFSEEEKQKWH